MIQPATISVDICICTFRRFHLALTLQSIASLSMSPELEVKVIVADNDDVPSAKDLVDKVLEDFPYPLTYLHAPARNISIARNACLSAATSTYVAFIDDDELATADWLLNLISQQRMNNATAVLGPVKAKYPDRAKKWIRRGDFHSIRPVWVNHKIITGYTSNVLFVRSVISKLNVTFNPALGKSGGEDTAFFAAIYRSGAMIDFAPAAMIIENVDPKRLSFLWLAKRYFRMGQTHAAIISIGGKSGTTGAKTGFLAVLKVIFCVFMTIGSVLTAGRVVFWLLRMIFHTGVIARLLGRKELIQYG